MAEGGIEHSMSDTESVPRHSSLYSDHSWNYVDKTSVEVCNIMTNLGYGEEIRRRRILKYREWDSLMNSISVNNISIITAGSKAEGLTGWLESDFDTLYVLKTVLCVEAGIDLHTTPDDIEVYRMDTRVYPGYCKMLLERQGSTRFNVIKNALCDDGKGNAILSSGLFLDELAKFKLYGIPRGRAGPSLPRTLKKGNLDIDYVQAIRCQCPCILQRWAARPRNWPAPNVVRKVVSLGSFVTPVGFKGSEDKLFEWRICFNTGETELVNNLNSTQAKLYVILKLIVKDVLNPKNKEVTSYVLKNIILWQAERNLPSLFQENKLFHWLHDALITLKTAIASTQLPYYMIPDRNLMAACGLQDEQQRKWVADITEMIEEGPRVILRLPKIRQAIICHPEPLMWFSRRRIKMEMLTLELRIRAAQCRDKKGACDNSDIMLQEIHRHQTEIVREVRQRMLMECSAADDLDDKLLGILM
ncbi:uncharacterized protein LOC127850724 [Dreissena polymorpha]|uniref:uncharacterized protein LOC127850724 n=1 Tax=Dreissena polymorpha TaxID=45954 RepID=UPI0022654D5B|nr:uncharacterized protein LOC127850724 [Dreissena polymorpha]